MRVFSMAMLTGCLLFMGLSCDRQAGPRGTSAPAENESVPAATAGASAPAEPGPAVSLDDIRAYIRAAGFGDLKKVEEMAENNPALLNAIDREEGEWALNAAARNGHIDVIKYMISKGADINLRNEDGRTALESAVVFRNVEMVNFLVSQGADVNAKNGWGETPLSYAKMKGFDEIAELLVKHGAGK